MFAHLSMMGPSALVNLPFFPDFMDPMYYKKRRVMCDGGLTKHPARQIVRSYA